MDNYLLSKESHWPEYLELTLSLADPTANGRATNGEIFYYAELPMLMRNLNIEQIKTFSKVNRKFVVKTEWDVHLVSLIVVVDITSPYF